MENTGDWKKLQIDGLQDRCSSKIQGYSKWLSGF